MTAELKNTQPYRQNKKPKQIKICFSLLGLWGFVSAQAIFMALLAQVICRLAAPAWIEEAGLFPEATSLAMCPKELCCCQFVLSPQSPPALASACLLAFSFNQSCDFRQAWTRSQLGSPGPAATALLPPIGTSLKSSLQQIGLLL